MIVSIKRIKRIEKKVIIKGIEDNVFVNDSDYNVSAVVWM